MSKNTKNNVPAITDLAAMIELAKSGYVAAILAEEDKKALQTQKQGNNADTRKAALREAVAKASKKDLAPVIAAGKDHPALAKMVGEIANNFDGRLSDEDAVVVMKQVLQGKLFEEFIKATYDTAKSLVFASLDNAFAEAGEEFPEHTNGFIDVPELGKRFCREGAGRKDAVLDELALRELLGDAVWESITTEEVIPAQTVRIIDDKKLSEAVNANPALLEQVRAAVKAGDWKTPRLSIRDIPAQETE